MQREKNVWSVPQFLWIFVLLLLISTSHAITNQFRGVNWADTRDNFQPGVIYLSGLSSSDNYESASIVADRVMGQFVEKLQTNSVRLPINEPTVSTYWDTYTGAIDVALTKGRVILCYWAYNFGAKPKDMNNWWAMWQKVVDKYGDHPNAYFEIYNEPENFSKTDLTNLYADWLKRYPSIPHGKILLDGTGMAQNVPDVGNDPRFTDCLLAVHDYSFWAFFESETQWMNHLKGEVGAFSDRTVMTEFGTHMKEGNRDGKFYPVEDYSVSGGSYFVHYFRGMTEQLRQWKMGSFYWIGLRDNDWYSLTTKTGSGANINLTINNQSGVDRMHYAWTDTVPVVYEQDPYDGIISIPGTIEAENYDTGGEGISFHDSDPENTGGVYRNDAVDLKAVTDGYVLGWTTVGEWLEYSVNIAETKEYYWETKVSSGMAGSSFRVYLDEDDITGLIEVPAGEDWDTYTTLSGQTISMEAGEHILKIEIEGAYANIDWISFTDKAITNLTHNVPVNQMSTYSVYDILGNKITTLKAQNLNQVKNILNQKFYKNGIYLLQSQTDHMKSYKIHLK